MVHIRIERRRKMALRGLRPYKTITALERGEEVDIGGGLLVKMVEGDLEPGDLYVAERNTGPHLLTCREINEELGCVFATILAYPFDTNECVKVCEA